MTPCNKGASRSVASTCAIWRRTSRAITGDLYRHQSQQRRLVGGTVRSRRGSPSANPARQESSAPRAVKRRTPSPGDTMRPDLLVVKRCDQPGEVKISVRNPKPGAGVRPGGAEPVDEIKEQVLAR